MVVLAIQDIQSLLNRHPLHFPLQPPEALWSADAVVDSLGKIGAASHRAQAKKSNCSPTGKPRQSGSKYPNAAL